MHNKQMTQLFLITSAIIIIYQNRKGIQPVHLWLIALVEITFTLLQKKKGTISDSLFSVLLFC